MVNPSAHVILWCFRVFQVQSYIEIYYHIELFLRRSRKLLTYLYGSIFFHHVNKGWHYENDKSRLLGPLTRTRVTNLWNLLINSPFVEGLLYEWGIFDEAVTDRILMGLI